MAKKKQQKDIFPPEEAAENKVQEDLTPPKDAAEQSLAKSAGQGAGKKRHTVFWLGVILLAAGAALTYYYPAVFKDLVGGDKDRLAALSLPDFSSASSSGTVDSVGAGAGASAGASASAPANAAAKKPSKTAARMAELESKLAELQAQMESQAAGVSASVGGANASTPAAINDGWKAMAEKLEGELAEAKENLAEVKESAAEQRAWIGEKQALVLRAQALRLAVNGGKDFTQELVELKTLLGKESNADFASKVQNDTASLAKFLPRVMTAKELRLAFPTLVENARHAPLGGVASDDFTTRVIDKMKSLVVVQKIGTGESSSLTGAASPDAIFAKAEKLVNQEDFAGAIAVLATLPPQMHLSFAKWEENVNALNAARKSADNLCNEAVAELAIGNEKVAPSDFSHLVSNQL